MVNKDDIIIIGAFAAGIYVLNKFSKPLESLAKGLDSAVDTTATVLDFGIGAVNDVLPNTAPSENPIKEKIQSQASYAARVTTTAYDNTRNLLELGTTKALNVLGGSNQATLDRYAQSFNNSQYVGNKDVRTTILYSNQEEVMGSYNNVLAQTLNASATKAIELNKSNPIVKIANSSSSSSKVKATAPTTTKAPAQAVTTQSQSKPIDLSSKTKTSTTLKNPFSF
jgi:hypothetical protein